MMLREVSDPVAASTAETDRFKASTASASKRRHLTVVEDSPVSDGPKNRLAHGDRQALGKAPPGSNGKKREGPRTHAHSFRARCMAIFAVGVMFLMAAAVSYGTAYWSAIDAALR